MTETTTLIQLHPDGRGFAVPDLAPISSPTPQRWQFYAWLEETGKVPAGDVVNWHVLMNGQFVVVEVKA